MKGLITIELPETEVPNFEGCSNIQDSLHEALCLAIHEGNSNALDWLHDFVVDIQVQQVIAV